MPIVSYRFNDTCLKRCPEKSPCILSRESKHDLCICGHPGCPCHSEGRYFEAKEKREGKE